MFAEKLCKNTTTHSETLPYIRERIMVNVQGVKPAGYRLILLPLPGMSKVSLLIQHTHHKAYKYRIADHSLYLRFIHYFKTFIVSFSLTYKCQIWMVYKVRVAVN